MDRKRSAKLLVLIITTFLVGCSSSRPFAVEMSFEATNTADRILMIEGRTNLPAGAALLAELRTRDGRVMRRDSGVVSRGRFFFGFGLDGLARLDLYEVRVSFDPELAPASVRMRTGIWGEAMTGPGVVKTDGRSLLVRTITVILSKEVEGQDWEGRDFDKLEVSERARIVTELERYLNDNPQDRSAKLALARAYIASDSKEMESGSRASGILKEIIDEKIEDTLAREASKIYASIESTESLEDKYAEQIKKRGAVIRRERFRKETTITPGRAIGSFVLGTPFRVIKGYLELNAQPSFSGKDGELTIYPLNFPDIDLVMNARTQRLVRVRTTSGAYRLPEGLGVGSSLAQLQGAYGVDAVPDPAWEYLETEPGGRIIYKGAIEASGIKFVLRREIEPVLGTMKDVVIAISVGFE